MAIIDFLFPTLTPKGWRVEVAKITKGDRFYIQPMVFENKDDAFEYYEQVRKIWQKNKGKIR